MGIHPADPPLLEQQDEDSFEGWQKRRLKEAERLGRSPTMELDLRKLPDDDPLENLQVGRARRL